jgi:hypothetical protein
MRYRSINPGRNGGSSIAATIHEQFNICRDHALATRIRRIGARQRRSPRRDRRYLFVADRDCIAWDDGEFAAAVPSLSIDGHRADARTHGDDEPGCLRFFVLVGFRFRPQNFPEAVFSICRAQIREATFFLSCHCFGLSFGRGEETHQAGGPEERSRVPSGSAHGAKEQSIGNEIKIPDWKIHREFQTAEISASDDNDLEAVGSRLVDLSVLFSPNAVWRPREAEAVGA